MKILICEDELIVAEYIKETCIDHGHIVVGIAKNREEATRLISEEKPNLVLLDMNMDERLSGVKIAEFIIKSGLPTSFIFITAFSDAETLEAAAKTSPQGYLVKPLDKSTLIANLLLANFKFQTQPKKEDVIISIETDSGAKKMNVSKLSHVISSGNYCDFYDIMSSKTLERVSMTLVEETFNRYLIRVHKSYCVNPDYVVRFSSLKLVLVDGTQIPIGRKFKENIALFLKK